MILIRIFEGSGNERGIEVKLSKVIDSFPHVLHFNEDLSCPWNRKNMNDQSLLSMFDQTCKPSSFSSRLSESGFSINGFSFLKLSSSCKPSRMNARNSYESC